MAIDQNQDSPARRRLCWRGAIDMESPTLGLPRLEQVHRTTLYRAVDGDDAYSHHSYVAHHRGVLYASWSNHACDEDASGQRVRFSRRENQGKGWRDPAELFPPHDHVRTRADQDLVHDRVLIPNGFAVVGDTLYAVAEAHMLGEPRELCPPPGIEVAADAPNRSVYSRPGLGRLARAVGPDGGLGPIFWLVDSPPVPIDGFPAYPAATDPALASVAAAVNAWLAQGEHLPSWEFVDHTTRPWAPDGHRLCEPTQTWRLRDGARVRLYRDLSRGSGCLYAQFCDGETWHAPARAEFPDTYSRAAAGNLPDGTAYVINNPGRTRDPLVLSLAAGGLNFDRHAVIACQAPPTRSEGVAKGAGFQYPRATVIDNALVVVYSVNKEDIEAAEIPLAELASLPIESSALS